MSERYAHVLVPDDPVTQDSRSAVLMVARELVRAHRASGVEAHLVASTTVTGPDTDDSVLPLLRGRAPHSLPARGLALLEGRLLGRRPTLARAYEGLESLTGHDVVLVHGRPEGVRRAPRTTYRVLYLHNDGLRRYSRRELAGLSRCLDLVVCVSQSLADQIPSALHVPRRVVLNGVDTAVFCPADEDHRDEVPTLLYCGRIIPSKGVHLLVEAAGRLRHLPFRLRVVGAGSASDRLSGYERRLRQAVARLGLADRVTFERSLPRAAIPSVMRSSDVLVVPSIWADPCPLTVLEGLASGLPVVAARAGGIPELGGSACRYHEPGDLDGLAQHLESVLASRADRRALGRAARVRALELTWTTAAQRLTRAVTEASA